MKWLDERRKRAMTDDDIKAVADELERREYGALRCASFPQKWPVLIRRADSHCIFIY